MSKISLSVISDTICPWCYIGYKELLEAIAKVQRVRPGAQVDVEYRPFLLDPTLNCKEPVDKGTYFLKKFGEQRSKQIHTVINARGADLGIDFKWGGTLRQTTPSHRMLLYAYRKDPKLQLVLLEKIFKAYFEQEKDCGDPTILAGLAEESAVMTKAEAIQFLSTDKLLKEVQDYIMDAQVKGITGVPCTIVNQKYAISGGQKSEVYLELFEKLLAQGDASS